MKDIITKNRKQTIEFAKKFAKSLKGGEVIALYGDLGSGKTTFVSGLVNYFIKGKRVLSPTFIIVRHYYPENTKISQIVHADLYRLKNSAEIEDLGLSEYFNNPKVVILIEWAERMNNLLPAGRINILFKQTGADSRKITYGQI